MRGVAVQFRLTINTDNAAFEGQYQGDDHRFEVARILRDVADRLQRGEDFSFFETLRDINGNDVGRAAHKTDEYWSNE